jgi:hypothetical protein
MVEPLRQPSWSSACGFVDGGRTPRRRAFRQPAAHNSTGSTTTIKLSINELHPLEFQKRRKYHTARIAAVARLVGVSIALIGRMLGFTRQVAKA